VVISTSPPCRLFKISSAVRCFLLMTIPPVSTVRT
jgi:hypothetical protein